MAPIIAFDILPSPVLVPLSSPDSLSSTAFIKFESKFGFILLIVCCVSIMHKGKNDEIMGFLYPRDGWSLLPTPKCIGNEMMQDWHAPWTFPMQKRIASKK